MFWQWLYKFSHSFVKVIVISHKKNQSQPKLWLQEFKPNSTEKRGVWPRKKLISWVTRLDGHDFLLISRPAYKDEENMVICLTCFQLFRCTVLILPQKLVNKLKKPKMTKLSMDKSLYFTRCTKRENNHKYFKKKKTSWKFCCWKGSDCGQPPVNSN